MNFLNKFLFSTITAGVQLIQFIFSYTIAIVFMVATSYVIFPFQQADMLERIINLQFWFFAIQNALIMLLFFYVAQVLHVSITFDAAIDFMAEEYKEFGNNYLNTKDVVFEVDEESCEAKDISKMSKEELHSFSIVDLVTMYGAMDFYYNTITKDCAKGEVEQFLVKVNHTDGSTSIVSNSEALKQTSEKIKEIIRVKMSSSDNEGVINETTQVVSMNVIEEPVVAQESPVVENGGAVVAPAEPKFKKKTKRKVTVSVSTQGVNVTKEHSVTEEPLENLTDAGVFDADPNTKEGQDASAQE